MKFLFTIISLLLLNANLLAQDVSRIDTTYTIDSLWRNDTLFIYKTMHLNVVIIELDSNKNNINNASNIDLEINPISYSYLSPFSYFQNKNYSFANNFYLLPQIKTSYFKSFYKPYNVYLDTSIKSLLSVETGIKLLFSTKKIDYSIGVNINFLFEKFSFEQNWNETTFLYSEVVFDNSYWNIDTVWILNTDSLIVGDTVYFPYYDSTYVSNFDTVQTTNKETNIITNNTEKINNLILINFPICFGKHYSFENFSFYFSAGIMTNIFLYKNYKIPFPYENNFFRIFFPKFYFSFITNTRFEYNLTKNINIWYGFNFSLPINNLFSINNNSKKVFSMGFSGGIKFKIRHL